MQLTIVLGVVEYGTGAEENILRLAGLVGIEWSPCTNKTMHSQPQCTHIQSCIWKYVPLIVEDIFSNNNPHFSPQKMDKLGPK